MGSNTTKNTTVKQVYLETSESQFQKIQDALKKENPKITILPLSDLKNHKNDDKIMVLYIALEVQINRVLKLCSKISIAQ